MSSQFPRPRFALSALAAAIALSGAARAAGPAPSLIADLQDTGVQLQKSQDHAHEIGASLLPAVQRDARALGYGAEDTFQVRSAQRDADLGVTHARFQQLHHGIPVEGARLLARDGDTPTTKDSGIPHIEVSPVPALAAADAIQVAAQDLDHGGDFTRTPKSELVYLPVWKMVKKSGARAAKKGTGPNSDDYERQIDAVHLAWKVTGSKAGVNGARTWYVDAHDGTLIRSRDAVEHVDMPGKGKWFPNATVHAQAISGCSGVVLLEGARNFITLSKNFVLSHPINCETGSSWGDGHAFTGFDGSAATVKNFQTAMVDGEVGATIYWEMMNKVWATQGPDNNHYPINVYLHVHNDDGSIMDDAYYSSDTKTVNFGDGYNGYNRTQLDCFGHELGHGWNDFNTGLEGPLNESLADVFGEWTESYWKSGNYPSGNVLGSNANWVNDCSGRNMINPARNGNPDKWSPGIENPANDTEVHSFSAPASRAFTFMALGASPDIDAESYSDSIPWGTGGLGLQAAARLYFIAHHDDIDASDYASLRSGMLEAAQERGTAVSVRVVENAYAGINVGPVAPGYPDSLPHKPETAGSHATMATAMALTPTTPPTGTLAHSPNKAVVLGTMKAGEGTDFYSVPANGRKVKVRVYWTDCAGLACPTIGIVMVNPDGSFIPEAHAPANPNVMVASVAATTAKTYIRVRRTDTSHKLGYRLDIDLAQ